MGVGSKEQALCYDLGKGGGGVDIEGVTSLSGVPFKFNRMNASSMKTEVAFKKKL